MEKKIEQVTQHLQENVLKQKVLEQEKDQAGAHFIMQEKNLQAKICALQEEKNEIKVSRGPDGPCASVPRTPDLLCGASLSLLIPGESEKDAGGA